MEMNNIELDALIDTIEQWIMEDENRPQILNPIRLAQIHFAHAELEKMTKGTDMRAFATMYDPFNSMGSICLDGDFLEFDNSERLGRAIAFADNVEIIFD